MYQKAKSGRDAFTFSLHGLTTIASFTAAPAIAQDEINKAWDEKFRSGEPAGTPVVRRIEDFLGRYFAPGCCQGA